MPESFQKELDVVATAPVGSRNIKQPSDLSQVDSNAIKLNGATIRNKQVPYKFSGVMVSGLGPNGKDRVHASILVEGKFSVDGVELPLMLIDRWHDVFLSVDFFKNRTSAFDHLKKRATFIEHVADVGETSKYTTSAGAMAWMQLAQEDAKRTFKAKYPSDTNTTSCIGFTMRFAAMGGHEKDFRKQLEAEYLRMTTFSPLNINEALGRAVATGAVQSKYQSKKDDTPCCEGCSIM